MATRLKASELHALDSSQKISRAAFYFRKGLGFAQARIYQLRALLSGEDPSTYGNLGDEVDDDCPDVV